MTKTQFSIREFSRSSRASCFFKCSFNCCRPDQAQRRSGRAVSMPRPEKQLARESARIENSVCHSEPVVCLCDYSRQFALFAGKEYQVRATPKWVYLQAQNSIDHRIVIGVKNRNRSVPVRHWHQFVLHPESRQPGLPSRNANTVA